MVELTVDGNKVEVLEGSMVMHAVQKVGHYVPHFCYHKKLSIAANCRMCLVEVEKAPKALPACATPATNGMVVYTCSERARAAQQAVMEFLLINHPLDCPICDQAGECQLQDLAVGYGASSSRYHEEKRVVFQKNLGPLISAEGMTRCIHCTRCVRFGQEIAGIMELGMLNRGEHAEITSFIGHAIESELSGNMIDVCPVGALTSKPFRFRARTWELARRRSISPHDSLGTNLVIQVKNDRVLRVVPFEEETINECWISDRDRFSYEGLNSEDRLTVPMVKDEKGQWHETSWAEALQQVAQGLAQVRDSFGGDQIGALASEYATLEEYALLGRLIRELGSENIDFRLRQTDPSFDTALTGVPWLGMPIADLNKLDRVLVVGSFLRKDHPLMAQRLRQAAKQGAKIIFIDCAAEDALMPAAARMTVLPSELPHVLAEVAVALSVNKKNTLPAEFAGIVPSQEATHIASHLTGGNYSAVLLGNLAIHLPNASAIAANAAALADAIEAKLGFLTAGANTVGGYLARAVPDKTGKTAVAMLAEPLKAYLVLHAEPLLDLDNGQQAVEALRSAQLAVALTSYRSAACDWAHVMLPIAPFTETSGSFINAEGRAQSFKGTVPPLGQTRPAWKVLRVLGNLLQYSDFNEETSEAVRDMALSQGIKNRLSNRIQATPSLGKPHQGLERVVDLPIYRSDAIVRRSYPLQAALGKQTPAVRMNAFTLSEFGLQEGIKVRVSSTQGEIILEARTDPALANHAIRIAAGFEQTTGLGATASPISLERF